MSNVTIDIKNRDFLIEVLQSLRILFELDKKYEFSDSDKMSHKFEASGGCELLEKLQ